MWVWRDYTVCTFGLLYGYSTVKDRSNINEVRLEWFRTSSSDGNSIAQYTDAINGSVDLKHRVTILSLIRKNDAMQLNEEFVLSLMKVSITRCSSDSRMELFSSGFNRPTQSTIDSNNLNVGIPVRALTNFSLDTISFIETSGQRADHTSTKGNV